MTHRNDVSFQGAWKYDSPSLLCCSLGIWPWSNLSLTITRGIHNKGNTPTWFRGFFKNSIHLSKSSWEDVWHMVGTGWLVTVTIIGGKDKWVNSYNIQRVLFDHVRGMSNRLGKRDNILRKVTSGLNLEKWEGPIKICGQREFQILRCASGPTHDTMGEAMTPVFLCYISRALHKNGIWCNVMSLVSNFLPFMFLATWCIGINTGLKINLGSNPSFVTK